MCLTILDLSYTFFQDASVRSLALVTAKCISLETLLLASCHITAYGMEGLAKALMHAKSLRLRFAIYTTKQFFRFLSLAWNTEMMLDVQALHPESLDPPRPYSYFVNALQQLHNLQHLDLTCTHLNNKQSDMSKLFYAPTLQILNLSKNILQFVRDDIYKYFRFFRCSSNS